MSEQAKPMYAVFTADLIKEGKIIETLKNATNTEGRSVLFFQTAKASPGLIVKVNVKRSNAVDEINLPVPFFKGSPVQFNLAPESGYLVSGLKNKMAFKAVNINGEPVDIEGTLLENGDSLLRFKSVHAGMGSFEFTPDRNKKYHIKLNHPQNDSLWRLPEILESGITLHLAECDSNFFVFKVKQNAGSIEKVVGLRGQLRGNVYFFTSGVLKEELEIKVAQKDFPQQGIAEFTLLDSTLSPLAERLVYMNSGNQLYIETRLTKEKYETREKAVLNIKVTDEDGQPVVSHLGVTVFDKIYQNNHDPQNIFTHFYLSSQLKGRIYDPAYYFDKDNKNRDNDLDLLLLTQGWRRYVWNEQELEENSKNSQQVISDGVKGKVTATKNIKKAPKGNQVLSIFNPAKGDDKYILLADSTGNIEVAPAHLKLGQGGNVYFKPTRDETHEYKIRMESPFDTIKNILNFKETISSNSGKEEKESTSRPFISGPNIIELGEVTVTGKQNQQFRDKYMGSLDSLTKLELNSDYIGECGWLNCPLCKTGKNPVEGKTYNKWVGTGIPEVISGMPGIHPFRFYANEVVQIVYHYPEFTEEELLKINNLTREKGYYPDREFYQPNYDKTDSLNMIPDYRNTLLWAPNVLTDRNGEAQLEFFCSDIYTGFVGIIEGVSGDGKLGSDSFEFKVLKTKPFGWEK